MFYLSGGARTSKNSRSGVCSLRNVLPHSWFCHIPYSEVVVFYKMQAKIPLTYLLFSNTEIKVVGIWGSNPGPDIFLSENWTGHLLLILPLLIFEMRRLIAGLVWGSRNCFLSFFLTVFTLCPHHMTYGILFPNQGSNPGPLQWDLGVITSGWPGKSQETAFIHRLPFMKPGWRV